jgi:hypothetical protein
MNTRYFAVPVFALLLSACGHGLNQAMLQQASRPGVYVQTSSELVAVPNYGAYSLDPFSQQVTFRFDHSIPQVSGPIAFVANLPGAQMSEAKAYVIPSLSAGLWHKGLMPPGDTKALESSIDVVEGSIYKVTIELPNPATGFLCLWVKMPSGTEDRMYAVQLK